jgi:L-ascorbate metabolism protein UlaG (beta-lactamase superfamily)
MSLMNAANPVHLTLTKKTHSCIRLEKDGRTLVIDPGGFSRAGLEANPAAEIWTLRSVAEQLSAAFPGRVHTVGHGDTFTAAGFDVQVHGELHAVIHPDIPRITNIGFLVDGSLFHPGDALTVPDHPVDTLMLPVMAPWNKISEVIDYVREVKPRRAIDIHDALLTDLARPIYDRQIGSLGGADHGRLTPGDSTGL